jgi:CheY-like chemotaxis protein
VTAVAVVLVVDDEVRMRGDLELILTELAHDVLTCADGKEAAAAVERVPVDVVITDLIMPNMDGIEVLRSLKESHPGLPIVAMAGGNRYDTRLLLRAAELLGAVATLEKPFGRKEVAQAIEQALGDTP